MEISLLDHFRPPLSLRRHWHAFHNAWATYLASGLNELLPAQYFAEPNVHFGIEIDVATFEEGVERDIRTDAGASSSSATQALVGWLPQAPALTVPFEPMSEVVEVLIYRNSGGPELAAAVELVSPANKDRPAHRAGFVAECETLLRAGAGLVVVDVVTERTANLHVDLLARIAPATRGLAADLYATAYRVMERDGLPKLDIWQTELEIGVALPVLPLWIKGGLCVPLDLGAAYSRTCREQRIPGP